MVAAVALERALIPLALPVVVPPKLTSSPEDTDPCFVVAVGVAVLVLVCLLLLLLLLDALGSVILCMRVLPRPS